MRVGLVTKWFASGQAVVSRQIRSALDELGHETFIFAKPGKGPRAGVEKVADPVWDQPGVTHASDADPSAREYAEWVEANGIETVMCDQNVQFDEIASLRESGVRTIGRFVWESFAPEHAEPAQRAYDVIYSFTRAEQGRYAEMGVDSPYVSWGCHPELLAYADTPRRAQSGEVWFVFPGGFLGHRKPLEPVLQAFSRVRDERVRLLIKAQVERRKLIEPATEAAKRDPRIVLQVADQPTDAHLRELASCDVCLAPARWEGLGLPLYEAIAFGQPAITNDAPPMNEATKDGVNGLLVASHRVGEAKSGIPALDPDIDELAAAIERLADDEERTRLAEGARRVRDTERRWEATVEGIGALLATANV